MPFFQSLCLVCLLLQYANNSNSILQYSCNVGAGLQPKLMVNRLQQQASQTKPQLFHTLSVHVYSFLHLRLSFSLRLLTIISNIKLLLIVSTAVKAANADINFMSSQGLSLLENFV